RPIHTTPRLRNGPTSLTNILASEIPLAVQVASVSEEGIYLEDGLHLPAACIFVDGKVFLWDVPESVTQWGREHLTMFEVVVPRPEILILGTGIEMAHPQPSFRSYLKDLGIQVDVMSTRNTCSTYNLLAEEGRRVAAALAPLSPRRW
ncbi:NADH dehydrogenase 1 alpha subcomplex assembly factor 3, partial [Mycena filopes]